jgi:2-polyprenyl-3-methyl-5-hydroxy-6-metoxy-1,4-benzoquinol methylase
VRMRAVRIRPAIVMSVVPVDLNIIVERLNALEASDRFDLIVATNVLVYYDAFEQALALANVSAMLRPGGVFLTNYVVHPRSPMESPASVATRVFWDRQRKGDTLFAYRRQ